MASNSESVDKKDLINLVISDVVDLTDGPFDVAFASDGGGTHIQVSIEHHKDAPKIVDKFKASFMSYRLLVLKVPSGYLDV